MEGLGQDEDLVLLLAVAVLALQDEAPLVVEALQGEGRLVHAVLLAARLRILLQEWATVLGSLELGLVNLRGDVGDKVRVPS